jgi:hypothetical protein
MALMLDARIPLVFGQESEAGPTDAVLLEGEAGGDPTPARDWFTATAAPQSGHSQNCACCVPRNEAGQALSRLLLARARSHGPRFARVIAVTRTPAGHAAVLAALQTDPLASSCFVLTSN